MADLKEQLRAAVELALRPSSNAGLVGPVGLFAHNEDGLLVEGWQIQPETLRLSDVSCLRNEVYRHGLNLEKDDVDGWSRRKLVRFLLDEEVVVKDESGELAGHFCKVAEAPDLVSLVQQNLDVFWPRWRDEYNVEPPAERLNEQALASTGLRHLASIADVRFRRLAYVLTGQHTSYEFCLEAEQHPFPLATVGRPEWQFVCGWKPLQGDGARCILQRL